MGLRNGHSRVVAAFVAIIVAGACGLAASSSPAASSMKVTEHVVLKLAKRTGATKFAHTGHATGTLSGSVRSVTTLTHSVVLRGTVTINTSRGELRLKIDGRARTLALRTRFDGAATIDGGTGRYAHARGTGRFTGIVNRSTWASTIDASGSFTY
ncbi:hypothetical protein [Baekduia sp.]|jgi:hypothetical protein|uniref:hypothetical protein n=1 Tax=Baekduia sp. TaxID=2600305 RepID=UPI002DFB8747|nr:hypothetical protein [Baekduia sp.]